jgi:hypothetical protein
MPAKSESDKSKSDLTKAAKWRQRAEECRAEMEEMTNESARRSMVLIARFYDQLAKQVEAQADELPTTEKSRGATSNKR